jgi:hypothetical protein
MTKAKNRIEKLKEKSAREAWKDVDNKYDMFAFLWVYRNKEIKNYVIQALFIFIIIMVAIPEIAKVLHDYLLSFLK